MGLKSGTIELNSLDKNLMFDFLSDVLDFEINFEQDEVVFKSWRFKLRECHFDISSEISNTVFLLQVECMEDLFEIERKFNFFQYRKDFVKSERAHFVLEKMTEADECIGLRVKDIDHRIWQVTL